MNKTPFSLKFTAIKLGLESVCGGNGVKRVVVLREGKTVFEGAESEMAQGIWSCTKSFSSTVLGLLIAEGKCSLDSKVCDFLPELKEHYPDLTFRHFATMTSGYRGITIKYPAEHTEQRDNFITM